MKPPDQSAPTESDVEAASKKYSDEQFELEPSTFWVARDCNEDVFELAFEAGVNWLKSWLRDAGRLKVTAEPERFTNEEFAHEVEMAYDRIKELEAELMEQARIVGMGAERELKLMTEVERYRAALEKIADTASWGVAPAGVIKFLVDGEWKDIRSFAREALK